MKVRDERPGLLLAPLIKKEPLFSFAGDNDNDDDEDGTVFDCGEESLESAVNTFPLASLTKNTILSPIKDEGD